MYPKSHLFLTLRTPDKPIGVQIDSIKSLVKYNLVTDGNNKFNFGYKSKLRHILARQWTTVLKYTVNKIYLCLYLGTDRFYSLPATLITVLFQLSGKLSGKLFIQVSYLFSRNNNNNTKTKRYRNAHKGKLPVY